MIKRIVQPQRWSLLAQSRRSPWRPSPAEPATESWWWPCDLMISAGVGGDFSGGGNILVVIGGSRVFSTKRHLHPFRIHIYFWHLHPVLVVVCSVHVRVRARERCQWMVNVILREFLSIPYKRGVTLPNSCSCQTQRSHSWFVYSRQPPEPQNKSKNIDRLRRVNHQKELD